MVDLRSNETLQADAGGENAPTVLPFGRHCFQLCISGAVGNRTYRVGVNAGRLETAPTGLN